MKLESLIDYLAGYEITHVRAYQDQYSPVFMDRSGCRFYVVWSEGRWLSGLPHVNKILEAMPA